MMGNRPPSGPPRWAYFGRRGATGSVYELYRMPVGPMKPMARLAAAQRLRKGLYWLAAGDDPALANELASGNFSFVDDALSDEAAAALIADWATRAEWPGRP